MPKILERNDVLSLLRQQAQKAGGQSAWCGKTGVEPATLSRALHQHAPPARTFVAALNFRVVYLTEENTAA